MTAIRRPVPFAALALFAVLHLPDRLAAQGQTLTFGFAPGQTTSGVAAGGGPASVGVVIGGYGTIPVPVPSGTGSAGLATALATELGNRGFAVQQTGSEVTVTAGPGGAPLQQGGGIGSTDTGVHGIRAKVAPGAGPGLKQNGGAIPVPNPQAQANQPGQLQIDAEVLKLINGVWTLLHMQVVVPVFPGDDGAAVTARAKQALENAGLKVNSIQLPPSVAPMTQSDAIGLDRTVDGGKVQAIGVDCTGGAQQVFPQRSVTAGAMPQSGPGDFDVPLFADGFESGSFSTWSGLSGLGQSGTATAFMPPNTVGFWVFGFGDANQPFQANLFPAPILGPTFYLPIDPLLTLLALPDPLGAMTLPLTIPPSPLLSGLELQMVAIALDPTAPNVLGSAVRTQGLGIGIR